MHASTQAERQGIANVPAHMCRSREVYSLGRREKTGGRVPLRRVTYEVEGGLFEDSSRSGEEKDTA